VKILVAGRFASVPDQGGATWAVLQYALGLEELGHDVMLVDPCTRTPAAVAYFHRVVADAGLSGTTALLHPDRTATGVPYRAVASWASDADLLLNLAGVLTDPELTGPIPRRVYVDLDPGFTQLWQTAAGVDMGLDGHHRYVTVGQAVGNARCPVPICGVAWAHTLPPVVLSRWPDAVGEPRFGVTTVANWRSYGSIVQDGVKYGQKAHAVRELIGLPRRLPDVVFEPAFSIHPEERHDLEALAAHGWRLVDPRVVAGDPASYQHFVQASVLELGVAKSGYVASGCGWFSDRSACYLASGRPVVAQDTGWTEHLPSGEGLLAFSDVEEAAAAIAEVLSDYERHCKAARVLAGELFDARAVLMRLIDVAGATA
jgi:hypothetical protein